MQGGICPSPYIYILYAGINIHIYISYIHRLFETCIRIYVCVYIYTYTSRDKMRAKYPLNWPAGHRLRLRALASAICRDVEARSRASLIKGFYLESQ